TRRSVSRRAPSCGRRFNVAFVALLLFASPAAAQTPCTGVPDSSGVPQKPGPPIRFGITPQVQSGQLGTGEAPPRLPEDPARQLAALDRLRPAGGPFVLRLHRFFWSDGEAGIARFLDLASF